MAARKGLLKEYSNPLLMMLQGYDALMISIAGIAAHVWTYGTAAPIPDERLLAIAFVTFGGYSLFRRLDLYRVWRGGPLIVELSLICRAWLGLFVMIAGAVMLTSWKADQDMVLSWLWMGFGLAGMSISRVGLRGAQRWLRASGFNQRKIVLCGLSETTLMIQRQLNFANWSGFQVEGYFDDRHASRLDGNIALPYLGGTDGLVSYVEQRGVDQIWLVYPLCAESRVKTILHALRHTSMDIRYVLDTSSFQIINQGVSEVAGVPMINLSTSPLAGFNRFLKEAEDRLLALLILMLISPLFAAIALGVKLSSPGPVFYRQERMSWQNRKFMMLKFRSMPVDVEAGTGPVWAKSGEARASPFGAFLRKTSLDELPQFINVLKGEMSIVGPRPERPHFVDKFKDQIPNYMKKHLVKAGITGWAQVNGLRGDTDLKRRIEYDLYYIKNWSVTFDLWIVVLTLFKGFRDKNAY